MTRLMRRVRTIGLERARVKTCLLNLAYNMERLVQRTAVEVRRQARWAADLDGTGLPAVA